MFDDDADAASSATGKSANQTNEPKENWQGPLSSVPVSMIRYCIQKCQLQERILASEQQSLSSLSSSIAPQDRLNRSVCVHLDRGGIRYRAAQLSTIDDAMNVRLDNVVVSRTKKVGNKTQHQLPSFSSNPSVNQQQQQQQLQNPNFPLQHVPDNEERTLSTMSNCLLPGSSVVMIELPKCWSPLFEALAKMVRREMWKEKRAKFKKSKDKKKAKNIAKAALLKAKKEKRVAKEGLLAKGSAAAKGARKKSGNDDNKKKKGGGGGKKNNNKKQNAKQD